MANFSAGFPPGPPAGTLPCGLSLALPKFAFIFGFVLPPLSFPPKLPVLPFSLQLTCNLSAPIQISSKPLPNGGGRVSNADPDPDLFESMAA
jgi:hypothetical protein